MLPLTQIRLIRGEPSSVNCHADCGVHSGAFEGFYFAHGGDAARGGNGKPGDALQFAEPLDIGSLHGAFVIHQRGKKTGAVRFEFGNYFGGTELEALAPSANDDVTAFSIERDDNAISPGTRFQFGEETAIYVTIFECGAADDDFFRPPGQNSSGPGNRANAAADTNDYFCAMAKRFDQTGIGTFAHSGVEINYVKNWIAAEAIEQAEHVFDGERALTAVNELHSFPILQIDTGDDHDVTGLGGWELRVRIGIFLAPILNVFLRERWKPPGRLPRTLP
jgi:hypothetical protein